MLSPILKAQPSRDLLGVQARKANFRRSQLVCRHDSWVIFAFQLCESSFCVVRNAWEKSQASRERDAIYSYLTAVFNLVAWWAAEKRALERGHKALRLRHINPFENEEPFAVVIRCTGWQLSWLLGLHSIPPCPCGQPSQIRAKRERRRRVDEE
jgi:hypothetical protein